MIVCIPSIGGSPLLVDLLHVLLCEEGVSKIYLYDNSVEAVTGYSPLMDLLKDSAVIRDAVKFKDIIVEFNHPETIYGSWNRGILEARRSDQNVAILNDDIILKPGSLTAAESVMTTDMGLIGLNYFDPEAEVSKNAGVREVVGTYRTTGFGGFAFILPPDSPFVDERFQWWYGDDDLAERVKQKGGRLVVALGAPVFHPSPSTTGNQHPWTMRAAGEDTVLFRELWPTAP